MRLLVILAQQVETPGNAFLKAGLLGAAIVALAGVVVYLWRDMKVERDKRDTLIQSLQNQRVLDAQAVTAQLMKNTEECVTALNAGANAANAQVAAMGQVTQALLNLNSTHRRG